MRQRKNSPITTPPSVNNIKNKSSSSSPSQTSKIFAICLITRLINSLLVQTYFNPDEHWQALEVAHRIAFGYGHLTWEWKKGLRSYLHPVLFAALYKILAVLNLDSPWFMARAPRMLQSVFAAVGDLYLHKFAQVLFGDGVANWAVSLCVTLFLAFYLFYYLVLLWGTGFELVIVKYLTLRQLFAQLSNWFMFFCIPRTLSNSLETVLTVVSLYYWPCMRVSSGTVTSGSRKCALAVAALACAIRPTSAITWIYVGLLELFLTRDKLKFVFLEVVPIGGLMLGLTFLLDRQLYGSWVIVPLNFLKFNFLSSGGDYYGTHPWHWYMTQGFTVMLFTHIPFSLAGINKSNKWKLSGLIAWVLGTYSLLGHKEFRFVLPVLPIALIFSGYSLASIEKHELLKRRIKGNSGHNIKCFSKLQMAVIFLLVTNLPMALYMSMVHQRGTEDVMNYLSKEASENRVKMWISLCDPALFESVLSSEEKGILDESDQFLMDPLGFITNFASNWSQPSHIVLFDSQEKLLKEFLASQHFLEIRRFFHAHFKVDRELQASVVVYQGGDLEVSIL